MNNEGHIYQAEIDIPSRIIRATECFQIIMSTKKVDVFKSRFQMLSELVDYLIKHENENNYLALCEQGFDNFKISYYDRTFKDYYYSLRRPSSLMTLLPNLYRDCLFRVAIDYGKDVANDINNLKKASSKYKKLDELILFFNNIKEEMKLLNLEGTDYCEQLEKNLLSFGRAKEQLSNYL